MKRANPANANNTPRTSRRRSAWLEPIGPEDSRAVTRGLLSKTLLSTRINPSAKKAKVKTTSEMLKTQNIRAKSWLFGSTTTRKAPSPSSTQPPIMTRLSTETLPPGTQLHFCSVAIRKRSREARMNAAHGASHGWLAENEQAPKGRKKRTLYMRNRLHLRSQQIPNPLPPPHDLDRLSLDQHFRRSRTRVVIRRQHHPVRPGIENRQQISFTYA